MQKPGQQPAGGGRPNHAEKPAGTLTLAGAALPVLLLALAFAIRLRASIGDLWLDEVWSWELARGIHSALEVFTGIHHDNNHHLATLFFYWLGDRDWWPVYRLPSVIAGTGTVFLAWWIGSRRSRVEGLTALIATGASYLLIHYSSEARGYAWAVFFALLAYYCLEIYLVQRWLPAALAFGASVCLGFSSHLTFVHVYLAALLWSLCALIRSRNSYRDVIRAAAQCHFIPMVFLLFFYAVDIRHFQTGGASSRPVAEVLGQTLALAFGGPTSGLPGILAAIVPVLFFCLSLRLLWREPGCGWIFLAASVILSPALFLVIHDTEYLQERHFLVSISILLFASSRVLAGWYRRGAAGKIACCFLLGTYLVANGFHTAELLRYGRGSYLEAIRYMAVNTRGDEITVSSDHHFRNSKMLGFYSRYLPAAKHILYLPAVSGDHPPEWLINHTQETRPLPPSSLQFPNGLEYALSVTYRSAPLSGFTWILYHRVLTAPARTEEADP